MNNYIKAIKLSGTLNGKRAVADEKLFFFDDTSEEQQVKALTFAFKAKGAQFQTSVYRRPTGSVHWVDVREIGETRTSEAVLQ